MEHIHAYVVSTVNIHGRYSCADSAVSFRAAHFFYFPFLLNVFIMKWDCFTNEYIRDGVVDI